MVSCQCPPYEEYSPCQCSVDFYDDGALVIDCNRQYLGDEKMGQVLDNILANQEFSYAVKVLQVEKNFLTKVPDQIKHLPQLQELSLYWNDIEVVISGSLAFNATEKLVELGTKIKTIEPAQRT